MSAHAASEVDGEALFLPIAIAHRVRAFAAAEFGGLGGGLGGGATGFGFGEGALGFGEQGGGQVGHGAFLGKAYIMI